MFHLIPLLLAHWHKLNMCGPRREVALLYGVEEVSCGVVEVLLLYLGGLLRL